MQVKHLRLKSKNDTAIVLPNAANAVCAAWGLRDNLDHRASDEDGDECAGQCIRRKLHRPCV